MHPDSKLTWGDVATLSFKRLLAILTILDARDKAQADAQKTAKEGK